MTNDDKKAAQERLQKQIVEALGPSQEVQEQFRQTMEPILKLQREYVQAVRGINTAIAQNQEKILGFMNGVQNAARSFTRIAQEAVKLLPPPEVLQRLAIAHSQRTRLDEAGFLPHKTMISIVEDKELKGENLSEAIEEHFRSQWTKIEEIFLADINGFDVDDEAKETFREALAAHRVGHYRSVCRLLFPEFERIIRYEVLDGQLKGLASQRKFRELAGGLGLSEAQKLGGMTVISLFDNLMDHMYLRAEEPEQVEAIRHDPIPNRNACLHGILVYNTAKNSINMLVMADFIYRIIGILKEPEEDVEGENEG